MLSIILARLHSVHAVWKVSRQLSRFQRCNSLQRVSLGNLETARDNDINSVVFRKEATFKE